MKFKSLLDRETYERLVDGYSNLYDVEGCVGTVMSTFGKDVEDAYWVSLKESDGGFSAVLEILCERFSSMYRYEGRFDEKGYIGRLEYVLAEALRVQERGYYRTT